MINILQVLTAHTEMGTKRMLVNEKLILYLD